VLNFGIHQESAESGLLIRTLDPERIRLGIGLRSPSALADIRMLCILVLYTFYDRNAFSCIVINRFNNRLFVIVIIIIVSVFNS